MHKMHDGVVRRKSTRSPANFPCATARVGDGEWHICLKQAPRFPPCVKFCLCLLGFSLYPERTCRDEVFCFIYECKLCSLINQGKFFFVCLVRPYIFGNAEKLAPPVTRRLGDEDRRKMSSSRTAVSHLVTFPAGTSKWRCVQGVPKRVGSC